MATRIGVFLCRCGGNISSSVDLDRLKSHSDRFEDVAFCDYQSFTCSSDGQRTIQEALKEHALDAVVIGCCTPKQYEELYRECIRKAGLNPYLLEMVNLREQVSYPHFHEPEKATEKALRLLTGAINRVRLLKPLQVKKAKVNRDVAVIGGGIAGITASLMLAKLGHQVYLIEKEPAIGGNMARVVKTFPTDDCAMCTLSPKLDEVGKNENIHLMSYSEVGKVEKIPEGLRLGILRKARYVDEETCTGCGECAEVCPVDIVNDYDKGLISTKKAVYKDFASAVPNVYTIDKHAMSPCIAACPVNQSAQGYLALVAQRRFEEAYHVICRDNPLPTVCGRVCSHTCETECTRNHVDEPLAICGITRFVTDWANARGIQPKARKASPKKQKTAVIGSGPAGLACAQSLASKGYPVSVFEKNERVGGMLAYGIPAYRLPPEHLDTDVENIKKLGVEIFLNTEIGRDLLFDELYETHEAIFISTGLQEGAELPEIPGSELDGIHSGVDFLWKVRHGDALTVKGSAVVIGGGNVAIDVARTIKRLGAGAVTILCLEDYDEMPAIRHEIVAAENEGIVIKSGCSVSRFMGNRGSVEKLVCLMVERIDITEDGLFRPVLKQGTETELACDTVFVAIGQRLNRGFLSRTHAVDINRRGLIETVRSSTGTGFEKVFAGGDVTIGPSTVIEAVAQGRLAADEIDCFIQNKPFAGPLTSYPSRDYVYADIVTHRQRYFKTQKRQQMPELNLGRRVDFKEVEEGFNEEAAVKEAQRCLQCGNCSDCRVCETVCEAKAIDHYQKDTTETIEVGAVIVATGYKEFDPSQLHYGYGKYPDVVTQLQFARMLDPVGPTGGRILRVSDGTPAKKIVMVQCVGSRSGEQGLAGSHRYCSRVCCMVALKHAGMIKKYYTPDAQIYICYIDIRAFGKGYEEYFEQVRGMGVKFIKGLPGVIRPDAETGRLDISVEDANTATLINIDADLVVLSAATEPADIEDLRVKLNITNDESGFIKEFHPKIRPTDTMVKNVFAAGAAQSPKDIPDTIAQAGSAAASVAAYLGDGYVWLNPMIADVNRRLCRACGRCEEGCEFSAVAVDPNEMTAVVQETMCEGCGKCAVLCPTGALSIHAFSDEQIGALIGGIAAETGKTERIDAF